MLDSMRINLYRMPQGTRDGGGIKQRSPHNEQIGSGLPHGGDIVGANAAIHLQQAGDALAVDLGCSTNRSAQMGEMNFWPP